VSAGTQTSTGLTSWFRRAPPGARRALLAAGIGRMLNAFDVMLYALLLATLIIDLSMSKAMGGLLASVTLLASALGGLLFGFVADRYGRKRALIASILTYSLFTGACGLARSVTQLGVFLVVLGLGSGGQWASGAALVSETWPAEHRGKALGLMQSSWAVGYGAAAIVTGLVLPVWGWRPVFFVGVLPAFFAVWVGIRVEEPAIWRRAKAQPPFARRGVADLFRGDLLRLTLALTATVSFSKFAWWAFSLWVPAYLSLPVESGGIGLSVLGTTGLIVAMQVGMWFGYVMYGFASDAFGRKSTYVAYLLMAAALLVGYTTTRNALVLLVLMPLAAFFGAGYASGFGAITAEIYPTDIRAIGQGFTYNMGRVAAAAAPLMAGSLAQEHGFVPMFLASAAAFVLAAVCWIWIPETLGRALE
jgi:MFS family permease